MPDPDIIQKPLADQPTRILGNAQRGRLRSQLSRATGTLTQIVAPAMLARAKDQTVASDDLSEVERQVRHIRAELLEALGDDPSPGQVALADQSTMDIIILSSLKRFILGLCELDGLVDKQKNSLFPCVMEYTKISKAAANRLRLLHLHERSARKPIAIDEYVREWRKAEVMPKDQPASQAEPIQDKQAQTSQTSVPKKKRGRKLPKGVFEGRGGGVVTPPSSVDSKLPADQISPPPTNGSEGEK